MAFVEPHDVFLADLAVTATYNAADGSHPSVAGLFDATDAGVLGEVLRGARHTFLARAASLDADPRGNNLVIDGTPYCIDDAQPDGTGWVQLLLNRAPASGFSAGFSRGFGA